MESDEAANARPGASGRPRGDVADALTGRLLDGRYRIGGRIARGGMASVYEAADIRLDRIVAVKIMHEGLGDDAEFAERFVREARAAAQISHPNVVAVYDQGDDHGTLFLAMEYIRGHTLRDVIRDEAPMSPSRALALLEPVVAALAAAHRAGLIHRDVKPENVLIASDGRIKVADFGLAKAVTADTQHTATGGVLIGTVSYLAPELVVDGRADPRADVYAAGVILYELLTGAKPHEGETPIQVAYKHVHEDVPPPSALAPRLPAYVDALVARATARDRTQRPADAGILLHQLRRVSQALADGVDDDPELTADLALAPPIVSAEAEAAPDSGSEDARAGRAPGEGTDWAKEAPWQQAPGAPMPVAAPEAPAPWAAAPDAEEPADTDDPAPYPALAEAAPVVSLARAGTVSGSDETLAVPLLDEAAAAADRVEYDEPIAPRGPMDGRAGSSPDLATDDHADDLPEAVAPAEESDFDSAFFFSDESPAAEPARPAWSDIATALREPTAPIAHVPPTGPPDGPVGPGTTGRPRRSRRGPLLLALALLVAAAAGVGAWWFGYGRYTQAPAVIGLSQSAAEQKVEDAGLTAEVVEESYSETVAKGLVIKATPVAGSKVLSGGVVELVISLGKERYDVPKLAGLTEDRAQDKIAKAKLTFGTSKGVWSETVKEGRVISQDPKPGLRVKPGTVVDLVISKGRRPIRFNDWTGKSAAEAKAALEKKGLVVDDGQLEYSDTVPEGFVISQKPATGTLFKGDTVTLVVSRGPELVEIPRDGVIAAGVDAARATLEDLGFTVRVRKDDTYIGLGFVLRSDPEPGTLAPKGSTVYLYLI